MISVTNIRPAPLNDEHSTAYWEAAARGELLIQRCDRCGAHQFYPRRHCIACWADEPTWIACSARGTLHTFSVVHRATNPEFADDCPYVFAIVQLAEGPRISTRIVDAPLAELRCDAAVMLCPPRPDADPQLPTFTLACD
jgi:hypothetical protein